MTEGDDTPGGGPPPHPDEESFGRYLLLYGGIFVALVGLAGLMILLLRFGR